MKKQRESVTLYRLEWIQGGEEFVEEHAIRARAQGRFEELRNRRDVVEIEFVKVGPKGREGIDFWLDDAERERRLDECIASEGRDDEDPPNIPPEGDHYPPDTPSEAELEHHLLHQEAMTEDPENLAPLFRETGAAIGGVRRVVVNRKGIHHEGLGGPKGKQPIEPDPAYEGAHCTAHDLIQRLVEKLHDLPAPDGGYVKWHHVRIMNDVNRSLFLLIEIVEKATECGT
jgi:hypothetical protein